MVDDGYRDLIARNATNNQRKIETMERNENNIKD